MKRATQEQLLNRRKDMLHYNRLGYKPKEWIPIVAAKHDASEEAVKRDWSYRKNWMRVFLQLDDAETLALDALLDHEIALADACELYEKADDVKTKIPTLWLRLKVIQMKMNYLRELGALSKLQIDYKSKADDHNQEILEEKYPFMKGSRDRLNRRMALRKEETAIQAIKEKSIR